MLLLDGREKKIFTIGCQDYLFDPIKESTFGMNSDKQRVAPVMRVPLERKVFCQVGVGSPPRTSATGPSVPC